MASHGGPRLAARAWVVVAVAGLAFFVLHVTVGLGGGSLDQFVGTWVYDGLEVLAVAAVATRAWRVPSERSAWALLAVGLASWTSGDVAWTVVYGGNPPFPSLADVFYLGFYPPTYAGLALLVRSRLSRFNTSVWLDGLMAALAVASVGAAVLLEVVPHNGTSRALADAANLAYPLGDIVLVAMLVGVFALSGWRPGRGWAVIGAALSLTAVADSLYLYQSAVGDYRAGTILDALWPASLLLLGAAAWVAPTRRARVQLEGRPLAVTPMACGVLALGVLVDSYVQHRNVVGVALASATLLTVLARTFLTFRENARMAERTGALAVTDSLTGLWNRRRLIADLDAAFDQQPGDPLLLVLYDLNGFKTYNDTYGHPAGDALLARLAGKLADVVPAGIGGCYRLGGDEFCALAAVSLSQTERFLSDTTTALSETGEGFSVSTAFGCVFLPEEASSGSEALHVADQRLYAQKYQSLLRNGQPHRILLQALYEREPDLHGHVNDVARLSLAVGRQLRLSDLQLEQLELAAQLHDIGKLAIPDATLVKPGPLDDQEWALIHGHTTTAQRILNASPAFAEIGRIIRSTHERWDGSGYPDRLAEDDIPLAARIIAVCDAYSAMISDRPYREPRTPQAAVAELQRCAGSQFDPAVVTAFREIGGDTAVLTKARTLTPTPQGRRVGDETRLADTQASPERKKTEHV